MRRRRDKRVAGAPAHKVRTRNQGSRDQFDPAALLALLAFDLVVDDLVVDVDHDVAAAA